MLHIAWLKRIKDSWLASETHKLWIPTANLDRLGTIVPHVRKNRGERKWDLPDAPKGLQGSIRYQQMWVGKGLINYALICQNLFLRLHKPIVDLSIKHMKPSSKILQGYQYGRVVQNFDWFLWSSKHCRCRLYCQICILQRVSPHEDVKGTLHHSAALAARKVHLHSPSSESLSLRLYGGAGASCLRAFPGQSFGGQSGRRSRTYELKSKFEHPEPATIGWRENSLLRKPLEDKTTDTTVDVFTKFKSHNLRRQNLQIAHLGIAVHRQLQWSFLDQLALKPTKHFSFARLQPPCRAVETIRPTATV